MNPPWYARFVEHNSHERETWVFYIPFEGNVRALRALQHWLEDDDDRSLRKQFGVFFEPWTEEEVASFCARASHGYMPTHNRLAGLLDLTRIPGVTPQDVAEALQPNGARLSPELPAQTLSRALYKGGIARLMIPSP